MLKTHPSHSRPCAGSLVVVSLGRHRQGFRHHPPTPDQPEQRPLSWRAHLSLARPAPRFSPSSSISLTSPTHHSKDRDRGSKKSPLVGGRPRPWRRGKPRSSSLRPRSPSTPPERTAGLSSAARSAYRQDLSCCASLCSLGATEI